MMADFKKKLWLSFAMVVGGMAIAATALYFLAGRLSVTTAAIVSDRQSIAKNSASVGVYAALKQQEAQADVYQSAMDQLLPTQANLINFDSWLANIAGKDGVSASISFTSQTVANGGASSVGNSSVTITATGDFNSLIVFLEDIQVKSVGFFVNLGSFQLTKQGNEYQFVSQGEVFFKS